MRNYVMKLSFKKNLSQDPLALWIPLPQSNLYQTRNSLKISTNGQAKIIQDDTWKFDYLTADFRELESAELIIEMSLSLDVRSPLSTAEKLSDSERNFFLRHRPHVPVNEFVQNKAEQILNDYLAKNFPDQSQDQITPVDKAKAIYQWIIEHGERDPHQVGCGLGNVIQSLTDGHICGRCVDISSVAVALLRSAGVPAREIFGIRVGPAQWTPGLGRTGVISESFHCKVEFLDEKNFWVVMDPGDVLKLMLDEKLELGSERVQHISEKLFGSADANWVAFNSFRDSPLSPSTGMTENYFMYPIGLILDERLNPYSPKDFGFEISVNEIAVPNPL